MSEIDFKGLAHALRYRARELLPEWLPGGKIVGKEYTCADIHGGQGSSFKVNVESGVWKDFASGDMSGPDLIALYAAIKGYSQVEAARALLAYVGTSFETTRQSKVRPSDERLGPPPPGVGKPVFTHHKYGEPEAIWTYKDSDGSVLFYVSRHFNSEDKRKEFCPHSWSLATKKWVKKLWPAPRPLYGLDLLAKAPDKAVLVVEGEKACDAARKFINPGTYVVVSWPSGSQASMLADWKPLHGRKVLLWPDSDLKTYPMDHNIGRDKMGQLKPEKEQPGFIAMQKIAEALVDHCPEVKVLKTFQCSKIDGWDAADAHAEGMDWEKFKAWAKPRAEIYLKPVRSISPEIMPEAIPMPTDADFRAEIDVNLHIPSPEASEFMVQKWLDLGLSLTKSRGKMTPLMNFDNVLRILEGAEEFKDKLWYDEFHIDIFTSWNGPVRKWTERDTLRLLQVMQRDYGLSSLSDKTLKLAYRTYAFRTIKHEVRDWMDTLQWDGVKRVENFLRDYMGCVTEPENYLKAVSENFWTALAARTYSPGCKFDNVVIFEGKQGKGKSTALSIIGGKWYVDTHIDPNQKDFYQIIQGMLLIEAGELTAFKKQDVDALKRVFSCQTDKFRAPYAEKPESHPRSCVFVGTTNDEMYLRDATGARRFWPVTTGVIDFEKIRQDRDQLFAEAVWRHKNGFPIWIVPVDEAEAAQDQRYDEDAWTGIITEWLARYSIRSVKIETIMLECLKFNVEHINSIASSRVRNIMRKAGYTSQVAKQNGKPIRVWRNNSIDGQEFDALDLSSNPRWQQLLYPKNVTNVTNVTKKDE